MYNWTGAYGTAGNFTAEVPGDWGGEYGGGVVTAFRTDPDPAGYCNFSILLGEKGRDRVDYICESLIMVFIRGIL